SSRLFSWSRRFPAICVGAKRQTSKRQNCTLAGGITRSLWHTCCLITSCEPGSHKYRTHTLRFVPQLQQRDQQWSRFLFSVTRLRSTQIVSNPKSARGSKPFTALDTHMTGPLL